MASPVCFVNVEKGVFLGSEIHFGTGRFVQLAYLFFTIDQISNKSGKGIEN